MKTARYHFQWFEKEDGRKDFRGTLGRDGKLRLGKHLRQALPPSVRIGFDPGRKVLAIADGGGAGTGLPKYGVVSARVLSAQITFTGLRLPLTFRFARDGDTGYFLGRVVPRKRQMGADGRREYDVEQLLILYQHIVDLAVGACAKSIPLAERRAYAVEAFQEAVRGYCPGHGEMEPYLEAFIHRRLTAESRQYIATYRHRSLDQPLSSDGAGNPFCLYDTLEASTSGGIGQLEERIADASFFDSLAKPEQALWRMLQEGYSLEQIAQTLNRTEDQLMAMGEEMAAKRQAFFALPCGGA